MVDIKTAKLLLRDPRVNPTIMTMMMADAVTCGDLEMFHLLYVSGQVDLQMAACTLNWWLFLDEFNDDPPNKLAVENRRIIEEILDNDPRVDNDAVEAYVVQMGINTDF